MNKLEAAITLDLDDSSSVTDKLRLKLQVFEEERLNLMDTESV